MKETLIPIDQPADLRPVDEDFFAVIEPRWDSRQIFFRSVSMEPHEPNLPFDTLDELFNFHWPEAPLAARFEWIAKESVALAFALIKTESANR